MPPRFRGNLITGGDIAYASTAMRMNPTNQAYRAFRRLHGVASCNLFHVGQRHLSEPRTSKAY